jgi:hypothetical protein
MALFGRGRTLSSLDRTKSLESIGTRKHRRHKKYQKVKVKKTYYWRHAEAIRAYKRRYYRQVLRKRK